MVFVHPALLDTLLKAFASLGINEADAQKRTVVLSYASPEKGIEKQLNIGPQWARLGDFLNKGKLDKEEDFSGDLAHETALLCYSSGTTGLSKGVEVRLRIKYASGRI